MVGAGLGFWPVKGGLGRRGVTGLGVNLRLPWPPLELVKGSPTTVFKFGAEDWLEMATVDSWCLSGAVGDLDSASRVLKRCSMAACSFFRISKLSLM